MTSIIKTKTFTEINKYLPGVLSELVLDFITPLKKSGNPEEQFRAYCELGYFEMAQEILDNNKIGVGGGLAITCQFGFTDIARIIIHKIDTKMRIGLDPANANGFQEIAQTIRDYSNDYKTHGFYQACVFGHYHVVKMLLENGINDYVTIEKGIQLADLNHQDRVQELLAQVLYPDSMAINSN